MQNRLTRRWLAVCALALSLSGLPAGVAMAAEDDVTLNFVGADIDAVVKAVAQLTGRNFLVDPRVKGTINIVSGKPIPKSSPNQTPPEVEEKVLHLRRKYHLGPERIMWYLARYHTIRMSDATIYRILKRHSLNRLPRGTRVRKIHTKRYNKQVPGHHIQMDVKFLTFIGKKGEKVRRFQYTAIDDATRVRALKVYQKHTQANAIDFVNHIIQKFPFRIREIRTDNGHEFQAKFHWHVEDLGIRHAYIKPSSPQLNGKVERSHRSDQQEFYQLLTYKGDVDLEARLDEWEHFYNFHRPHGAFKGQTPYEALRERLS